MSAQPNICSECGGRFGHVSPFCRKLDLTEALAEEEEILSEIDAALQIRQEHKRLREILFEAIDDGRNGVPWGLYHPFESVADSERTDFVDAVLERLGRG